MKEVNFVTKTKRPSCRVDGRKVARYEMIF